MAWTEQYAKSRGWSDTVDRVLARWEPPEEVRPGWRHAVTVLVTPESPARPPPRDTGLGKVAFFPPPNPDGALWFRVLIGHGAELAVRGAVEVGTLRLPSGGMVGVIVRPGPLTPGTAEKVAEIRAQMLAAVTAAGARRNTAFAWGRMADDAVLLIDPGPPRRRTSTVTRVRSQHGGAGGRNPAQPDQRRLLPAGNAARRGLHRHRPRGFAQHPS
ncbi:hypothetical protein ACQPZQ_15240 [Pseudonocardia sp. CA-142604]|uniref:hypothetical protein n=1 Tax=Pseudonocardia sp. CA-142604 TaxID=3240024 RepID=UPI003D929086